MNSTDEPLACEMLPLNHDFPTLFGEPDYLGLKLVPSVSFCRPLLLDCRPHAISIRVDCKDCRCGA